MMTSTRPYLIRAFHQWIVDNDLTPYVVINAEFPNVFVPNQYIEEGRIILNISSYATDQLEITNQFIEFDASFSGAVEHISAPIQAVIAIYAKENGRGMVFGDEDDGDDGDNGTLPPAGSAQSGEGEKGKSKDKKDNRPSLRIVK